MIRRYTSKKMPISELYEPKHWFQTPEPCCKPGYTGYLPELGNSKCRFQHGETYGQLTHKIMKSHPVAGLRMGYILDFSKEIRERLEEEALAWKHEVTSQDTRYRRQMVSGYSGYVPRRKFLVGKAFDDECKQAVALMEKVKIS